MKLEISRSTHLDPRSTMSRVVEVTDVDSPHSDADDGDHLDTQDNTLDTTVTCVMYGSHHYRSGTVFLLSQFLMQTFLRCLYSPCMHQYIYNARMF